MKNLNTPKLTIVGAGPGDVELITLKAVKALENADVVLYDALVNEELLHYAKTEEIVFTKSATESLNLLAYAFSNAEPGSQFAISSEHSIVVSEMEHHSNIVPWQMVCKKTGAKLKVAPITLTGEIRLDAFERELSTNTKFVAINYVSNALGTISRSTSPSRGS